MVKWTILEVFQGYAEETAPEGKLFNFVLKLCPWVSLSSKNVFEIFFHCLTKEVSLETTSLSSFYPDTGYSELLSKLFNKTNQIPGEPGIVIHFATLNSPLHVKTKKSNKIKK